MITVNPRRSDHEFRLIRAGLPMLYFSCIRIMTIELSGFYCRHMDSGQLPIRFTVEL